MSGEAARLAYLLVTGVIGVLAFIVALVKALFVFALHVIIWLLIYVARALVMLPIHYAAGALVWFGLVSCGRALDRVATQINRSTTAIARLLYNVD
jgi:hypothetical protein